jgi:parallel beta-helix repeat protein
VKGGRLMSKNHFGIFVLAFLLIGMFAYVNQVQKVEAASSPPLTINADGSVTPSTMLIASTDNVTYTLTDNITTDSGYQVINILRDNIILDGAGYAVQHVNRYNGIYVGYRDNVTIKNLRIVDSGDAIRTDADTWLTIDNCTLTGNYRGVFNGYTAGPTNFTFTNNEVRVSTNGLYLADTADSIISGNTIQAQYGLTLWADNVTIKDNLITGCSWTGIQVNSASNTRIFDNTFTNNGIGMTVPVGTFRIYHNRFINNNEHARGSNLTLFWDDGYPSGGNYWGGFVSPDLYNGEYQNITGGDGIGDQPYISLYYGQLQDRYPLMLLGVSNVSQTPPMSDVLPNNTVEVNATVRHVYPVTQVILNCTYANSSATWTDSINMTNLEDDIWHGNIPPFPAGTNVTYEIVAYDDIGNSVSSEDQGYIFEYPVVPEFSSFLIVPILLTATLVAIFVPKRKYSVKAVSV